MMGTVQEYNIFKKYNDYSDRTELKIIVSKTLKLDIIIRYL